MPAGARCLRAGNGRLWPHEPRIHTRLLARGAERGRSLCRGRLLLGCGTAHPRRAVPVLPRDYGERRCPGCASRRHLRYLGVPYAAPPIGKLRWRPPQPRAPWAPLLLDATAAAPVCSSITQPGPCMPGGLPDAQRLDADGTPRPACSGHGWLHTGGFPGSLTRTSPRPTARDSRKNKTPSSSPQLSSWAVWISGATVLSRWRMATTRRRVTTGSPISVPRSDGCETTSPPSVVIANVTLAGTSAGATSISLHLVSPPAAGCSTAPS